MSDASAVVEIAVERGMGQITMTTMMVVGGATGGGVRCTRTTRMEVGVVIGGGVPLPRTSAVMSIMTGARIGAGREVGA